MSTNVTIPLCRYSRARTLGTLLLGGLLALSACHAPSAPPKIVAPSLPHPPPAPPPAPPLLVPPPVPTVWSFATGSAGCAALASGEAAAFGVTVHRGGAVDFIVSATSDTALPLPVGASAEIAFHGPAGSWTAPGVIQNATTIRAHVAAGDEALGMVLAVLSGGTAQVADPAFRLPEVEIPPAGAAGTSWFGCARGREHG